MPEPDIRNWVLPESRGLARRPLVLGLPFSAAGALLIIVGFVGIVLKFFAAAAVLLFALWAVGAALARYDPWAWEILSALIHVPKVLRAC